MLKILKLVFKLKIILNLKFIWVFVNLSYADHFFGIVRNIQERFFLWHLSISSCLKEEFWFFKIIIGYKISVEMKLGWKNHLIKVFNGIYKIYIFQRMEEMRRSLVSSTPHCCPSDPEEVRRFMWLQEIRNDHICVK